MSSSIRKLNVESVLVSVLKPYHRNARTHSQKQIRQIANSIETFGWTNPVLADAKGGVIAGHGRVEAAKLLGLNEVPVIRIEDMSEAQKRAYILADMASDRRQRNHLLTPRMATPEISGYRRRPDPGMRRNRSRNLDPVEPSRCDAGELFSEIATNGDRRGPRFFAVAA